MPDPPRHDWKWYEERTRAADAEWFRRLTPAARFAIVCEMYRLVSQARDPGIDRERLEEWRWQQKLAARRQAVDAFQKLDSWRERTARNDSA